MTKTLTEQWKNGKLNEGLYYVEGKVTYSIALIRNRYNPVLTSPYCEDVVFEPGFVPVAPVPNYGQFVELTEKADQFSQLLKKIEELKQKIHILNEANMNLENTVGKLGEQLKEANDVIKHYADGTIYLFPTWYNGSFKANDYLEKWGVE